MYCKNCGAQMDNNANACVYCGFYNGTGNNFCQFCGNPTINGAPNCPSCGAILDSANQQNNQVSIQNAPIGKKSKIAAGLLAIFLGVFGIHNFYLGYTKKGTIQIVISLVLSWTGIAPIAIEIWAIVEAVKILSGNMLDAEGMTLHD